MTCFNVNSVKYNRKMHKIEANSGEGLETVGPLAKDSPCESDPVTKITISFIQAKKITLLLKMEYQWFVLTK